MDETYPLSVDECDHKNKWESVPDGTLNGKPAVVTTCQACGLWTRHTK